MTWKPSRWQRWQWSVLLVISSALMLALVLRGRQPVIPIHPQVTYITGPLTPAGYPDYLAYFNQQAAAGTTPDNNALVVYLQAFGTEIIPPAIRDRFLALLHIPAVPTNHATLIGLDDFWGTNPGFSDLVESLNHGTFSCWSKNEFPRLAAWLERNEQVLALIKQGLRRPRYYHPYVASDDHLGWLAPEFPLARSFRDVVRAWQARALLRIASNDIAGAVEDMLAIHLLARHLACGLTPGQLRYAWACDLRAWWTLDGIASSGKLHCDLAESLLQRLEGEAPWPTLAERINEADRCAQLQLLIACARHGMSVLHQILGNGPGFPKVQSVSASLQNGIGSTVAPLARWQDMLVRVNMDFDELATVLRVSDSQTRLAAIRVWEKKAVGQAVSRPRTWEFLCSRDALPRTVISQTMPSVGSAAVLDELVAQTLRQLGKVQLALVIHRHRHGQYPRELRELSPAILRAAPRDPFSGHFFVYQRSENGYLLYSVGRNQIDDGGKRNAPNSMTDDLAVGPDVPGRKQNGR